MKMKKVLAMALAEVLQETKKQKALLTVVQKQKQAVQVLQEHRRRIPTQSTYVQNRLN